MTYLRLPLQISLLALFVPTAVADIRLPSVLGSHMVIQRDSSIQLWGWAEPGESVEVQVSWLEAAGGDSSATTAGPDGRWALAVQSPPAGGPHTIRLTGQNTLVLEDVYSGEVWICSGQSNMDWHVAKSEEPEATAASATDPLIRLFDVEDAVATAPADDVQGSWQPCSPEAVTTFSAVAFHFGTRLREGLMDEQGGVPIGLISTNWGGTVAESWTSAEGLAGFPEFAEDIERIARVESGVDAESSLEQRRADWWADLEQKDPGFEGKWMVDAKGGWREAKAPLAFADLDLGSFDGVLWMRRDVMIEEAHSGQDFVLDLGPIDDMDRIYWDGQLVNTTQGPGAWRRPRRYGLSPELTTVGRHKLCIVVVDTGGVGSVGISQGEPYPMALALADGTPVSDLAGPWHARQGVAISELGPYPANRWLHHNRPTMLFNGMIAPLLFTSVRGAIWYQGESNRPRAEQYRTLFPAMIQDWRRLWGTELPFYYVQIAPFGYGDDRGEAAQLREAQAMALALPSTGMVVTMDIGNPRNIHPHGKNIVGRRLGNLALHGTYGQEGLRASGPHYQGMTIDGGRVRLAFGNAPSGLRTSDGKPPSHFTVSGADGVWHAANAVIEGDEVVVDCAAVETPVAVRFAWGAADQPNLCDGDPGGLPVSSFRTDG